MIKNILLIFTISVASTMPLIAQTASMEILSFPTEISKISWGPVGPIDKPLVVRFKNITNTVTENKGKMFFSQRSKSVVQQAVNDQSIPLQDKGVSTSAIYNAGSTPGFGTAERHGKILLDDATADPEVVNYLNYVDNGDGTFNVDMVVSYYGSNATTTGTMVVGDEYTLRIAYFGENNQNLYCVPTESDGNGGYQVAGWTYKGDPNDGTGTVSGSMSKTNQITYAQDNVLSIHDFNQNKKVELYPNPTNGLLHISDVSDMQRVTILNLLGQNVKTLEAANTIDVSDLNNGVYFLSTDTGLTRKFIKK